MIKFARPSLNSRPLPDWRWRVCWTRRRWIWCWSQGVEWKTLLMMTRMWTLPGSEWKVHSAERRCVLGWACDVWWLMFRDQRYVLQGSRWRVRNLSYRITKYPKRSGLSRSAVDKTIRKAFDVWERPTGLTFTEDNGQGKVHIEIRFERRAHGDDDPFDGLGGTLAHAFFPVYGGDVHFDDEEVGGVRAGEGRVKVLLVVRTGRWTAPEGRAFWWRLPTSWATPSASHTLTRGELSWPPSTGATRRTSS